MACPILFFLDYSRFQTEAHRAKYKIQFHRANSDDTIWFVALAKEQLTLVTEHWFHGISFR
jgi:hypothetical protein